MGVGSFEKNQFSNVRNCTSAPGRLCHEDKHCLSLMNLNSSLVVFSMYGPQSVVHFGWALTVDCCPVLLPVPMVCCCQNFGSNILGDTLVPWQDWSKIAAHAATEKSFDKRLATAIWW